MTFKLSPKKTPKRSLHEGNKRLGGGKVCKTVIKKHRAKLQKMVLNGLVYVYFELSKFYFFKRNDKSNFVDLKSNSALSYNASHNYFKSLLTQRNVPFNIFPSKQTNILVKTDM